MNKYDMVAVEYSPGEFYWCIFETSTEQVIDFFVFKEDATERLNFLKSGGAFAGFTPSFILNSVKIVKTDKDINNQFKEIL